MKTLLKGGHIVSEFGVEKKDILFCDTTGKIMKVEDGISEISEDIQVKDVSGKYIFPGFIDAHTHFDLEVGGTVTADDFESGTKAAILGGTTTIVDFATQNRGESLKEGLENWKKKSQGRASCDYGFHMAISDWNEDVKGELQEMIDCGITSFKLYMTYPAMVLNDQNIYEVLKALKEVGGITGIHCENMGLINGLVDEVKKSGNLNAMYHPITRPDYAESEAVHRLLVLAKAADAPVIVVHLSTKLGYDEIIRARKNGQEVYIETCPQYLLLDDSLYGLKDGIGYICSPPLRKEEDQDTLWNAMKNDQIYTIATDHCSFTMEQKSVGANDFTKVPNGMPGVETRPQLLYHFGVGGNKISIQQFIKLLSENPAKLYGMYPNKGCIRKGSDADLVVWDPDKEYKIEGKTQESKAGYSPFEGVEGKGKAVDVFLRGKAIVLDEKVAWEKQGGFVKRGVKCN